MKKGEDDAKELCLLDLTITKKAFDKRRTNQYISVTKICPMGRIQPMGLYHLAHSAACMSWTNPTHYMQPTPAPGLCAVCGMQRQAGALSKHCMRLVQHMLHTFCGASTLHIVPHQIGSTCCIWGSFRLGPQTSCSAQVCSGMYAGLANRADLWAQSGPWTGPLTLHPDLWVSRNLSS